MLGPVASNVTVHGFLDSAFWLNLKPMSSFVGFEATTQGVYKIANVEHLDDACVAANAGNEWKWCVGGSCRRGVCH